MTRSLNLLLALVMGQGCAESKRAESERAESERAEAERAPATVAPSTRSTAPETAEEHEFAAHEEHPAPPAAKTTESERAPKSEPGVKAGDGDGDGDGDDGPETIESQWLTDPFDVDLDGNGRNERVSIDCEDERLTVKVGAAEFSERFSVADLIGCHASVLTLDPNSKRRQLWVTVVEHEEAGDPIEYVFAYAKGSIRKLWSEAGSVTFYVDGTWRSVEGDCNDADAVYTTWTRTMRLEGTKVKRDETVTRENIDPQDCAEP